MFILVTLILYAQKMQKTIMAIQLSYVNSISVSYQINSGSSSYLVHFYCVPKITSAESYPLLCNSEVCEVTRNIGVKISQSLNEYESRRLLKRSLTSEQRIPSRALLLCRMLSVKNQSAQNFHYVVIHLLKALHMLSIEISAGCLAFHS